MIAFSTDDRVPVKIGDVTFTISPLSAEQITHLLSFEGIEAGTRVEETMKMIFFSLKYAVKGFSGITRYNGDEVKPEFDDNGLISDSTVNLLLGLECKTEIAQFCTQLPNGIRTDLPGIEVVIPKKKSRKTKKA